ncbi:MAG: hypothetical protein BWY70_01174 [Bacteroidetes bacterium ADurb.Bin408]|nr:MAG: hypothetical protein BWY70_01174 [Bacteroidetes bacterium ADurb.Bin408]
MKNYIIIALKGYAMGVANVIPGVSGGTIALITGIFERLINAIKSFNLKAIKLLFTFKLKEFAAHTDLKFLGALGFGIIVAIFSLAKLLEFLFENYSVYIWAYFFGLILASIYFVGKTITKISAAVIITFIIGAVIAMGISLLTPATQNENLFYVFLCGIIAISCMILPGISGSFILILLGNYELIVIESITQLRLGILIPFAAGCGVGLLGFSYFLSWVFKKFRNETISILTGFILGSLLVIWPWKHAIYKTDSLGQLVFKKGGEPIIMGYDRYLPDTITTEVVIALLIMIAGMVTIWLIERFAQKGTAKT